MAQCYQNSFEFPRVCRRVVDAHFEGGEITSDGGSLLLRQADRYLGLTEAVAKALSDPRRRKSCIHDAHALVRQRVYAVALGYEDLNDHDELRREVGLQTAVERDRPLASASTLCRFENRADEATAWRIPDEQSAIMVFVQRESANIDRASDLMRQEINAFQEYRTRLIADVVTGKLDVRDAASQLPELSDTPDDGRSEILHTNPASRSAVRDIAKEVNR